MATNYEEFDASDPLIRDDYAIYDRQMKALTAHYAATDANRCEQLSTDQIAYSLATERVRGLAAAESPHIATDAELQQQVVRGQQARNELIERTLPFAAYLTRLSLGMGSSAKYGAMISKRAGKMGDIRGLRSPNGNYADRVQTANEGLIKAVDKFTPQLRDDGKPVSFLAYAEYSIHSHLMSLVSTREANGLVFPQNVIGMAVGRHRNGVPFSELRLPSSPKITETELSQITAAGIFESLDQLRNKTAEPPAVEDEENQDYEYLMFEDLVIDDISMAVEEQALEPVRHQAVADLFEMAGLHRADVLKKVFGITTPVETGAAIAKLRGTSTSYVNQLKLNGLIRLAKRGVTDNLVELATVEEPYNESIVRGQMRSPNTTGIAFLIKST